MAFRTDEYVYFVNCWSSVVLDYPIDISVNILSISVWILRGHTNRWRREWPTYGHSAWTHHYHFLNSLFQILTRKVRWYSEHLKTGTGVQMKKKLRCSQNWIRIEIRMLEDSASVFKCLCLILHALLQCLSPGLHCAYYLARVLQVPLNSATDAAVLGALDLPQNVIAGGRQSFGRCVWHSFTCLLS